MSINYTLCHIATGAFTSARVGGNLDLNPAPDGHAWVEGTHNPLTRRAVWPVDDFGDLLVDVAPTVVSRVPAPPPENEWMGWAWDATAEAWREAPKLKLLQANARPPLLQLLVQLDGKEARPVGELLLAQAMGWAAPAAAVERLSLVSIDKQAVRDRLSAIEQASSPEALAELLAEPLTLSTLGG